MRYHNCLKDFFKHFTVFCYFKSVQINNIFKEQIRAFIIEIFFIEHEEISLTYMWLYKETTMLRPYYFFSYPISVETRKHILWVNFVEVMLQSNGREIGTLFLWEFSRLSDFLKKFYWMRRTINSYRGSLEIHPWEFSHNFCCNSSWEILFFLLDRCQ